MSKLYLRINTSCSVDAHLKGHSPMHPKWAMYSCHDMSVCGPFHRGMDPPSIIPMSITITIAPTPMFKHTTPNAIPRLEAKVR